MAQQHNPSGRPSPNRPAGDRPQPPSSYGLPNFYPPNTITAAPAPAPPSGPGNYNPYQYHQPPPQHQHYQPYPPQPQYQYNMPPGPGGQYYPPMHDPTASNYHQPSAPMRKSPTNSIDSNIRSIDNAIQGTRGSIGTPNQADTRSAGMGPGVAGYPNPYNNMRMGSGVSNGSFGDFDYGSYYPPNAPNMPNMNMPNAMPNPNMNIPPVHGVRGAPPMNMSRMAMLPPAEQARQAFVDADKDKSGYITFREFLESLTNLDVKIPYADALALFSTLDTDKDGRVVESEFVNGYLQDGLGRRNNNSGHQVYR